jgi:DNA replication protein DnaC
MGPIAEEIKQIAGELKLPLLANYESYIKPTKAFEEKLLTLLEKQLAEKEQNSIERRIRRAKFPFIKTLDTFEFDEKRLPDLKEEDVRELAKCEYIEKKHNVIAVGNPGTGKTHICIALGIEAIKHKVNVLFKKAAELVNEMSRAQQELDKYLKKINKFPVLIIDEMGYLSFNDKDSSLLFQIIAQRYETKTTIITTNLHFSEWGDFLEDKKLITAIIDRLSHKTKFLNMFGDSYRLMEAESIMVKD